MKYFKRFLLCYSCLAFVLIIIWQIRLSSTLNALEAECKEVYGSLPIYSMSVFDMYSTTTLGTSLADRYVETAYRLRRAEWLFVFFATLNFYITLFLVANNYQRMVDYSRKLRGIKPKPLLVAELSSNKKKLQDS